MTWTQVQKQLVNGAGSTAGNSSVTFAFNVTEGNLVLAIVGMNFTGQTTIPEVSGLTRAWQRLGTDCGVGIWYGTVPTTGPLSVSGTGFLGEHSFAVAEYSFTAEGRPVLDQSGDHAVTAATSITGSIGTTTDADEIVVAATRLSGTSTAPRTWSTFWVEEADTNSRGSWATLAAAGMQPFSTTYTWTTARNACMAVASFKPVAVPLAERVKVRLSNALVSKPSFVRLSNQWVPIGVTEEPAATVPGAPTIGSATAEPAAASVGWTAPTNDGGATVTGYVVTPYIGAAAQTATTFNSTATRQTITGLTAGTAYTFKVAAINAIGTGAQSAASASVTPTAPSVDDVYMFQPGAPLTFDNRDAGYGLIARTDGLESTTRRIRFYANVDNSDYIDSLVFAWGERRDRALVSLSTITSANQVGDAPDYLIQRGMAKIERARLMAAGATRTGFINEGNSDLQAGVEHFKDSEGASGERGSLWRTIHGGSVTLARCYLLYKDSGLLTGATLTALKDGCAKHRDQMFNSSGSVGFDFGASNPWPPWRSSPGFGDTENHKLHVLTLGFLLTEVFAGDAIGTTAADSFRRSGNTTLNSDVRIRRSESSGTATSTLSLWHYFRDALYRYSNSWTSSTSPPTWMDHARHDVPIVEKNALGYLGIFLGCFLALRDGTSDAPMRKWCEIQFDRLLLQFAEHSTKSLFGGYHRRSYHGGHAYAGPYWGLNYLYFDNLGAVPPETVFRSGFFRLLQTSIATTPYNPTHADFPKGIIEIAHQKRGGYMISEGLRNEGNWVEQDFSLGFLLKAGSHTDNDLFQEDLAGGCYIHHRPLGGLLVQPFHEDGPYDRPRHGRRSDGVMSRRIALVRTYDVVDAHRPRLWASDSGFDAFPSNDIDQSGNTWLHFRAKSTEGRWVYLAVRQANGTRSVVSPVPSGSDHEGVKGRVWEWSLADMPLIWEVSTSDDHPAASFDASWAAFKASLPADATVTTGSVSYASPLGETLVYDRAGTGHQVLPWGPVDWNTYAHGAHNPYVTNAHASFAMDINTGTGGFRTTYDWDPGNNNAVNVLETPTKAHGTPTSLFVPDREPVYLTESTSFTPGYGWIGSWSTQNFPRGVYGIFPVLTKNDGTEVVGDPVNLTLS